MQRSSIRTRGRWKGGLVAAAAATSLALLLPGPVGAGIEPVNHFQCWDSDFAKSEPANVRINDGAINTRAEVRQPQMLCAPVEKVRGKDGTTEITHPTHHLVMYAIAPEERTDQAQAIYGDQFNLAGLLLEGPTHLLAPTRKEPHLRPTGLDHYQCYRVTDRKGGNPDETMQLTDQFKSRSAHVGAARHFCVPTTKRHDDRVFEPENQSIALVCYATEPRELNVPRGADIRNQFGRDEDVKVHTARRLCAPAEYKFGISK